MTREDAALDPRGLCLSVAFFLAVYITCFLLMRLEAIPEPTTIIATLILDLLIVLLILGVLRFLPGGAHVPKGRAGVMPFTIHRYVIVSALTFSVAVIGVLLGYVMQFVFVWAATLIIAAGTVSPLVLSAVICRQIFLSRRAERMSGGPPTTV